MTTAPTGVGGKVPFRSTLSVAVTGGHLMAAHVAGPPHVVYRHAVAAVDRHFGDFAALSIG